MDKSFEYKGVCFSEGTPIDLCEKLLSLYASKTRITLDYGHVETKESWGEIYDITGRIGKSTGKTPILILVHNSRSMGGSTILTHAILSIKESKGKKLLYQLK